MNFPESIADISDVVVRIFRYKLFEINQTPITLSSLFLFFLIILVFFVLSSFLNKRLLRKILSRFQVNESIQFALVRIGHYVVMFVGVIVAFQSAGIDLGGLVVVLGFLSVGIGFGLQNITSNFVSGLILLFERPIKVGDRVTVGDTEGDVVAINMRSTTIRTLNNIAIIVPNSNFISSNVINWSHGDLKIRLMIEVGVSYGSDPDLVRRALQEVADEHPEVLKKPESDVLFVNFGDSSWNIVLRVWIDHPKRHHIIRSEINFAIVRKFREYGVEIPFPQRDIHMRSPLPDRS